MKYFIQNLKTKAKSLKSEIVVLYYAYKHPDTGMLPKVILMITIAYALSPIDLIPDFIPVLGYLDDLIILPALISLSIKLIPEQIIRESRERSEREHPTLRKNWIIGIFFIIFWCTLLAAFVFLFLDQS
jgi:uncharacterized membrane protein YkvA (DUF1232 family)